MEKYLFSGGIIVAILFVVRHLMAKARKDAIINSLFNPDNKAAELFKTEFDRLNQEIKDADIAYSNAKRNAGKPSDVGGAEDKSGPNQ